MATRATVVVEIPTNEIGKIYSFKTEATFKYPTQPTTIPSDKQYISIYNHFDGGEDSLGKELTTSYNTFKDVMENIICGGDMSYIGCPYHAMRGEDWEYTQPKFHETIPNRQEDYLYLFSKDGEWFVQSYANDELKQISNNSEKGNSSNLSINVSKITKEISSIKEQIENLQATVTRIEKLIPNSN